MTLRVPDTACARERTADLRRGVDFGVTDWATFDDGQTIANPRWLREELPHLAALRGMLGNRAQDVGAARACVSALRAHGAARPEQRVGGAHRRKHAWDGRGGETQTWATATWQVQVCDPRNPRDNAMR